MGEVSLCRERRIALGNQLCDIMIIFESTKSIIGTTLLMKPILITLLSVALASSCANHEVKRLLTEAESLMQDHPDSALSIIESIDTAALMTKAQRADFSLLHAMALDKNYIDTTDLRVIAPAFRYFRNHGSDQNKMRTLYYQGRIYINADDYSNAVISLNNALEYAQGEEYLDKGRIYTYDDYDRIATMREIVPDGKWLEQTISYGSDGNVSGVGYSTQDGVITTESYTYSYGHNTRISLPDGTLAWRLDSENDLGMPTSATTGSVTREYGYTSFGLPTYRRMDNGALQDFTYQFDVTTGNLLVRQDGVNGQAETFGYDNLNRLTAIGGRQISYSDNGNVISMDGVGTMSYENGSKPYQITSLHPADEALVPSRAQSVSYTCYDRPSVLVEGGRSAAFTYNGDGDRVKMYVADGTAEVLTRHYIGSRYEHDHTPSGSKERLYLGGDAYSAPMVYQRENGGSWTLYNIGRDYLGNVTHIATSGGTLVAEYSYDPWGRLRDPDTHAVYSPGQEPELFLGRGFTGHEHLSWFGLVNMNARLYDPLLGRFLSPDPYVQALDFTQNFNRYIYCLNNPLVYVDENGEWFHIVIFAAVGGIGNLIGNWKNCDGFWEYLTAFGVGAAGGAAVAATGGAAAAGGSLWATASVIGVGAASGAATGATNDVIRQTGKNFNGIENVDWNSVGISAASGGVAGAVGTGVGMSLSGVNIPININGTVIESPVVSSFIIGGAASGAGHIAGGTTAGMMYGQSFSDAFGNSFKGLGTSMLVGGAFSAASTAAYDLASGISPLDGKSKYKIDIDENIVSSTLDEYLAIKEAAYADGKPIIRPSEIGDPKWQGWTKMQYIHRISGTNKHINIHYMQKIENGVIYKSGFKIKP